MSSQVRVLLVIVLISTTVLIRSVTGMKTSESNNYSSSKSASSEESRSSGNSPTNTRDDSGDGSSHSRSNDGRSGDNGGMDSDDTDSDKTDSESTREDSGTSDNKSESGSFDSDQVGSGHTDDSSRSHSKETSTSIDQSDGNSSESEDGDSSSKRTHSEESQSTGSHPTNTRGGSGGGGSRSSHSRSNNGRSGDNGGMDSDDKDGDETDSESTWEDSGTNDNKRESGSFDSDQVGSGHTDDSSGSQSKETSTSIDQSDGKSSESEDEKYYISTTKSTTGLTSRVTTKSQETAVVTSTELDSTVQPCLGGNFTLNGVTVSFPTSETGAVVNSTQRCPSGSSYMTFPLAIRRCYLGWEDPEFNRCFNQEDLTAELDRIGKMNITKNNTSDVVLVLLLASNQQEELTEEEVDLIQQILSRVVQVNHESSQVTDSIVGVIDSIMELDEDVLSQIPDAPGFVENLEEQITNIQKNPGNYSQIQENLAVEAVKVNRSSLETPYQFNNPLKRKRGDNQFRSSSITLPPEILDIINKAWPDIKKIPLTFLAFRESNLFVTSQRTPREKRDNLSKRQVITSQVISATVELDDVTITNLPSSSRVVIRFESENDQVRDEVEGEPSCVFWDYSGETRQGEWSTAGCTTLYEGEEIICSCNHLTSFAVLFSETTDTETYHLVLHYVTFVGCVISIVCLTVCLVIMFLIKSIRVRQPTHIHINLCIALLALYMTFLLGVDKTENPVTCKVISALIHFFCLCSMAWMSVEAFSIYKMIWKVERSNVRYLLPVSFILAWGIPAVVAILVFFLDNSHSYDTEPDYCFLHEGYGFYFGFLTIGAILTLYNCFVFILAVYRVNCRGINATEKSEKRDEVVRRVVSSFLFWILLGLSWIFGFLSTFRNPTSQAFRLLFCLFLSLQGFFMFYLLILQNAQVKKHIVELFRDKTGRYTVSKTSLLYLLGNRSITASANMSTSETKTKEDSK